MALALVAATPEEPSEQQPSEQQPSAQESVARLWRLDLPISLVAQAPTSGVDTRVVPWLGVRAARMLAAPPGELLMLGADLSTGLGFGPNDGTSAVRASRVAAALEARALLGLRALETTTTGVRPYGYASVTAGGALSTLSAYADQSLRLVPVWGLGAGAGLEITAHLMSLRVELGAGIREGGLALTSSMAAGVAF